LVGSLLLCTSWPVEAKAATTEEQYEARHGAWDTSVRLEEQGRVREARQLLLDAWGLDSPSYEVTVRIAWLSLRLEEDDDAVTAYRRARMLPGAGPEATQGLVSALVMRGYRKLAEGRRGEARSDFREALSLDPKRAAARDGWRAATEMRLSMELWGAYVGLISEVPTHGGAGLFSVRFQPLDELYFRGAYRHVEQRYELPAGTTRRQGAETGRFAQNGGYLSAGLAFRWWGLEAMGMILDVGDEDIVPGQAARIWAGRSVGAMLDQAALFRSEGVSLQLTPMAFAWPLDVLAVSGGARFTIDSDGTGVAGRLGLTVATNPFELYVNGFVGRARWPVTFDVPTVLTLAEQVDGGGTLTAYFSLTDTVSLGLNGAAAKTTIEDVDTAYLSAGLGLRIAPSLETEP
jgi:hypothetical protein